MWDAEGESPVQEATEIAERVRNEAAHQDETTPDALAYNVNTFELEVEKYVLSCLSIE